MQKPWEVPKKSCPSFQYIFFFLVLSYFHERPLNRSVIVFSLFKMRFSAFCSHLATYPTPFSFPPPPILFLSLSLLSSGCAVTMETATWVFVSLCVLQVQTLYYSADHKLLDGGLLEGQAEVFGAEDDRVQFVQVLFLKEKNKPAPNPV